MTTNSDISQGGLSLSSLFDSAVEDSEASKDLTGKKIDKESTEKKHGQRKKEHSVAWQRVTDLLA